LALDESVRLAATSINARVVRAILAQNSGAFDPEWMLSANVDIKDV
jgi:hypothetical protein